MSTEKVVSFGQNKDGLVGMLDENGEIKCTAVCPVCGSDLSFQDNECICKSKSCSWHCTGCKSHDDI